MLLSKYSKYYISNIKIISSILYKSILTYFKTTCRLKRKIKDISTFDDNNLKHDYAYQLFMANSLFDYSKVENKSYRSALTRYMNKFNKKEMQMKELSKQEESVNNKIYMNMSKFKPDTYENEIEILTSKLYNENDLKIYYVLSKKSNFDISENIIEFLDKIYKVVMKEIK